MTNFFCNWDRPKANMTVNGLTVRLNLPKMLPTQRDTSGEETDNERLPEYAERMAFLADDYHLAPTAFSRSDSQVKHFMVPIQAGRGLWLDFTDNEHNSHDIAVVVSVRGVSALTAQAVQDHYLEQYRQRCPKHDVTFGADRYCPRCGWKWPAQNYLATTTGKRLWIDGFRTEDGTVRQTYFTEDMTRDVAQAVLGKNAVPCLGLAFYKSKKPKPFTPQPLMGFPDEGLESFSFSAPTRGMGMKSIGIGAGARLRQDLGVDPKSVEDYWEQEPAGLIHIHYVTEEVMEEVLAGGKVPRQEGGLTGLPFGAP